VISALCSFIALNHICIDQHVLPALRLQQALLLLLIDETNRQTPNRHSPLEVDSINNGIIITNLPRDTSITYISKFPTSSHHTMVMTPRVLGHIGWKEEVLQSVVKP